MGTTTGKATEATLELRDGVKWTRRFGPDYEEWTRESPRGRIDFDFSASVVEDFLMDTGLFTPAEARLLRWGTMDQMAELVASKLAKRAGDR